MKNTSMLFVYKIKAGVNFWQVSADWSLSRRKNCPERGIYGKYSFLMEFYSIFADSQRNLGSKNNLP